MIVYGCYISSEERFRRWAGVGLKRVMQPEDMSALATDTGSLGAAYDEIVDAIREHPGCEALVLVREDVEITEPHFAARIMRRLREPGTDALIAADGAVVVLSPWALRHVRFERQAAASGDDIAALAADQVRRNGSETREEEIAVSRPAEPFVDRPAASASGPDGVRPCTICGEALPLAAGDGAPAIVTCRECGVGVRLPAPTRVIESDGIWEEQYGGNRLQFRQQWLKESRLRLDWVQRSRGGGSLVDVGCGTGEVITVAAERGFEASGVEPSPWGAQEARKLTGVTVVLPSVEEWASAHPGRRADIVTLFHVLEHVHEPAEFLEGIRAMLASDGLLFIEVPNFGSIAAQRDPLAWTGTATNDHVLHYTAGSLGRLLRATGFRVLEHTPMPSMIYDEPSYWAQRCQGWMSEGLVTPPENLLRVLATPSGA